MKVVYDPYTDSLNIYFREGPVSESDELEPEIIADYDKEGHILGLEILSAKEHVDRPDSIHFELEVPPTKENMKVIGEARADWPELKKPAPTTKRGTPRSGGAKKRGGDLTTRARQDGGGK